VAHFRIVAFILALASLPVGLARAQYLDEYDYPAAAEIRGENIWVRVDPAAETEIVRYLQRGDEVTLTGEAVAANGIEFVPVETDAGETGWVRDLAIDPRSLVARDELASGDAGGRQDGENRRQENERNPEVVVTDSVAPEEEPPPVELTPASVPRAESRPTPELSLDYIRPDERSGPYAGFAVRLTNNTDAEIVNPQTEVVVELGGEAWNCQGYGDLISGAPVTGFDVLLQPLVIPAGEEMSVVIYCRIPKAPLDTARLRLR
jgi:hypothetical protein